MGIGIAGLFSAITGILFLLPGDPTTGVLGISYQSINLVHTWSSLIAIAGVGAHMALHWKWMVAMTKQIFAPAKQQQAGQLAPEMARGEVAGNSLSRRAFLVIGGVATVVTAAVVAGYQALQPTGTAEASQSNNQLAAAQQQASGVACPFGLVNDPYPGRCRHYRDSNGDGFCDYSIEGSGSNLNSGSGESQGFSRQRPRP
jgi:hypothetical protein